MNHETPQRSYHQIEEQGADNEYVKAANAAAARQAEIAERLGGEPAAVNTGPTVLIERSDDTIQPARLVAVDDGNSENRKYARNKKGNYRVTYDAGGKESYKHIPEAELSDEVQQERAAVLAGKALRGAGVEVAASSEAQEAAPEAVAPADDIEAYLKRAQENRLAAEARGETPFAEAPSENTNEASEYVPGEFAGKLYKFKQDYTRAAQEAARGADTSLDALKKLSTLLDTEGLKDSNKQVLIDQFEAIKGEAGKGVQDANSLAQGATELLRIQDDGDSARTTRLHELASDLSNKLQNSGSEAAGYAQRLLDTLDALRNENGSENMGRVQEELSSDIRLLRVALSSSHGDWGLVENRLEDLTQ